MNIEHFRFQSFHLYVYTSNFDSLLVASTALVLDSSLLNPGVPVSAFDEVRVASCADGPDTEFEYRTNGTLGTHGCLWLVFNSFASASRVDEIVHALRQKRRPKVGAAPSRRRKKERERSFPSRGWRHWREKDDVEGTARTLSDFSEVRKTNPVPWVRRMFKPPIVARRLDDPMSLQSSSGPTCSNHRVTNHELSLT